MQAVIASLLRWFFVGLLAASGLGKLADMPGFYEVVANYQVAPLWLIPVAAWALVAIELSLALAFGFARFEQRFALLVTLHLIYFAWIAFAYVRGLVITNCGCFGVFWPRPLSSQTLIEDLVLLFLAALLWRLAHRPRSHNKVPGLN